MAKHVFIQQLTQTALTVVRDLGLTEALRRSSHRLPRGARLWLKDWQISARLRAGDWAGMLPEMGTMVVDEEELKRVFRAAWALLEERSDPGDYLEFGVYVGTSMSCMHDVLEERELEKVRLFGFDSFEGLPADTDTDDTSPIAGWTARDLKAPYELCHANLTQKGIRWDRTTLIKGFFENTLTPDLLRQHGIRKASVIMVDSDLYSSAKTVLEFCAPLIHDHAVILFDDWWPGTLGAARTGERRAFEEFLAAHPDLAAEELESYAPQWAKVFLVSRSPAPAKPSPPAEDA